MSDSRLSALVQCVSVAAGRPATWSGGGRLPVSRCAWWWSAQVRVSVTDRIDRIHQMAQRVRCPKRGAVRRRVPG
ncbi:hypothetical protein [Actinophytocola sediminis]